MKMDHFAKSHGSRQCFDTLKQWIISQKATGDDSVLILSFRYSISKFIDIIVIAINHSYIFTSFIFTHTRKMVNRVLNNFYKT